jgi:antitoxin component of RelBE/YafQ-DinJ toxin-antitoxin module
MKNKTIQTRNIQASVLEKAESRAIADGLSSVQDAVRIFITKYSKGEIRIGFDYDISEEREEEYIKDSIEVEKGIKEGKSKVYDNVDDLLSSLENE